MFKRAIDCVLLAIFLIAALAFSIANDSIIFVNLAPYGGGIETPLWAYTIALLFIGALFGMAANALAGRKKIQK